MNMEIDKVILNGTLMKPAELKKVISALSDRKIIVEKGGFIFNVLLKNRCLNIGILPYFIDGQRTHHYDIDVGKDKFILIGFINSSGSMTLLFKLTGEEYRRGLFPEEKKTYRKNYIQFASFLMEYGFPGDFEFDQVSRTLLKEADIINEKPINIKSLAELNKT